MSAVSVGVEADTRVYPHAGDCSRWRVIAAICREGVWMLAIGLFAESAAADTLLVPSQYPTIQAAINAAIDGDEVIVADGVYTGDGNRDIDFLGKAITVRSENGAAKCIIDCEGSAEENHRGFTFHSGEGQDAVLDGFTISNGYVSGPRTASGGGISCINSSPTIQNCSIVNCTALGPYSAFGGGIIATGGTVIDCTVSDCRTISSSLAGIGQARGGGARVTGTAQLIGCMFIGNSANAWIRSGGAVHLTDDALMSNCTLIDNSASAGGGVYAALRAIVRDTAIIGNTARANSGPHESASGGGAALWNDAVMQRCLIIGNSTVNDPVGGGGGVACSGLTRVESCLVAGNWTDGRGGGIRMTRNDPIAANCIVVANSAASGGGVAADALPGWDLHGLLVNSVVVGNTAPEGNQLGVLSPGSLSELTVSYCNVEGGSESVAKIGMYAGLTWGPGNIDADSLFVDADGPDDDPLTYEDNDYRLRPGSPCIDAGDNLAVAADTTFDLAGEPRFHDDPCTFDTGNPDGVNALVDMGAYEFQTTSCDLDFDGDVDADDLAALLAQWGECEPKQPCPADLAPQETGGDGVVGPADLAQLLANWS